MESGLKKRLKNCLKGGLKNSLISKGRRANASLVHPLLIEDKEATRKGKVLSRGHSAFNESSLVPR